jgi:hypothetical protein
MTTAESLPFLLRYEESPSDDSLIDGLDHDYFFDDTVNGMEVRTPFVPWDYWLILTRST